MKSRGNILLVVFFALLISSCNDFKDNELTQSESIGSIAFKVDKTYAPTAIVLVRATLTRPGYQSIISSMNLKTSETAELLLTGITTGIWHLRVEGMDGNNLVVYIGESDVEIKTGMTSQVSMVLSPLTYPTGNIQIYVSWSGTNTTWKDSPTNPILTSTNNGSPYGPYFSRVLYDEGKFKMWFSNSYGSDRYDIGYAESNDGLTWQVINKSVLKPGPTGSWDSYGVHAGAVIKENGIYKMYFCGQSIANQPSSRKIGLATSPDGINWYKTSEELTNQINLLGFSTSIVKVNGTYFLYYGNNITIGVAISYDGISWSKNDKSIILASEPWEGSLLLSCGVIYEDNKFKMVYSTASVYDKFGYAESYDGINWTKRKTPVFSYSDTYNRWPYDIRYPYLVKDNQKYFIYYSTISGSYNCKIGVATASTLY